MPQSLKNIKERHTIAVQTPNRKRAQKPILFYSKTISSLNFFEKIKNKENASKAFQKHQIITTCKILHD